MAANTHLAQWPHQRRPTPPWSRKLVLQEVTAPNQCGYRGEGPGDAQLAQRPQQAEVDRRALQVAALPLLEHPLEAEALAPLVVDLDAVHHHVAVGGAALVGGHDVAEAPHHGHELGGEGEDGRERHVAVVGAGLVELRGAWDRAAGRRGAPAPRGPEPAASRARRGSWSSAPPRGRTPARSRRPPRSPCRLRRARSRAPGPALPPRQDPRPPRETGRARPDRARCGSKTPPNPEL